MRKAKMRVFDGDDEMRRVEIDSLIFDPHFHARQNALAKLSLGLSQHVGLMYVEPNLSEHPIVSVGDIDWYQRELLPFAGKTRIKHVVALNEETTPGMIEEIYQHPLFACFKLYFWGTTTNSEKLGVKLVNDWLPTSVLRSLEVIQALRIPLQVHFQVPSYKGRELAECQRETCAVLLAQKMVDEFPDLRIFFEHVSTFEGVRFVEKYSFGLGVHGSLMPHYFYLISEDTHDPHHFCKSTPNTRLDRDEIMRAALSGNSKFIFGSDNAPHPCNGGKENLQPGMEAKAGVFNAPTYLPAVVDFFDANNSIGRDSALVDYFVNYPCQAYGEEPPKGRIVLVNKPWVVPEGYGPVDDEGYPLVRPFLHGQTLNWQIESISAE